jgi:homogentisate 1,2-dioxygenase
MTQAGATNGPLTPTIFAVVELLRDQPARMNLKIHHVDGAYTLRIARLEGAFPWHDHADAEEAWIVLRGRVRFRSAGGDAEAGQGDIAVIPAQLRHSPLALEDDTIVVVVNRRDFPLNYTDSEMSSEHANYVERELAEHAAAVSPDPRS